MNDSKNITLQRYDDGTPSVLRKKTVYTELFFYLKSDILVQLTKAFCDRFLPKYGDRTVDQMVQAARSIKQNIAEGLTDGQTSFEVEMKLLGIAKGSNQELLEDFQDYLKHHQLSDWGKVASNSRGAGNSSGASNSSGARDSRDSRDSRETRNASNASGAFGAVGAVGAREANILLRYNKLLAYCRAHNALQDYEPFFQKWSDEEMCNTAICLCHMVDKMMTSFLEKRDHEFVEEGGIRERMTAARLDRRGTQKEIIAQLEAENALLKARVASLEQYIRNIESIEKSNSL